MIEYEIKPARYSKGNFAIHTVSDGSGFKTRAMRLAGDHLKGKWSNREKAYIVSAAKVVKFEKLMADGKDCCVMTGMIEN